MKWNMGGGEHCLIFPTTLTFVLFSLENGLLNYFRVEILWSQFCSLCLIWGELFTRIFIHTWKSAVLDASGHWFGKQALSALQYWQTGFQHCAAREAGPFFRNGHKSAGKMTLKSSEKINRMSICYFLSQLGYVPTLVSNNLTNCCLIDFDRLWWQWAWS